jgi:hypothetical protein
MTQEKETGVLQRGGRFGSLPERPRRPEYYAEDRARPNTSNSAKLFVLPRLTDSSPTLWPLPPKSKNSVPVPDNYSNGYSTFKDVLCD